MTYESIITALEARGMMPERPPSLEPMKAALERLGYVDFPFVKRLRREPLRSVIVAGTNGKGSVCSMLEALLTAAGERVALYTSPHLVDVTERFRIGSRDMTREEFCSVYKAVDAAVSGVPLSHFEMLTLMALYYFCSGRFVAPPDRMILEVGLGGLWDATNAVRHGLAVITVLGKDHENLLGTSLGSIARNKFGVIKPADEDFPHPMQVVHHPLPEETIAIADEVRSITGSSWTAAASYSSNVARNEDGREPIFLLSTEWGGVKLSLPGKRAAENAALALTAFSRMGFDPARYIGALAEVRWPGRMEKLTIPGLRCPVYLSGDHNPQGVQSLLELLKYYPRNHLHIIAGVGRDKDLSGVLDPLLGIENSSLYLTETPFRGRPIGDYGAYLKRAVEYSENQYELFRDVVFKAKADEMVLVTGSLYLVGEIKKMSLSAPTDVAKTQTEA